MVANIKTVAFQGVDSLPVEVQVHLAPGQNAFNVVGLPDKSVAESREPVAAAASTTGPTAQNLARYGRYSRPNRGSFGAGSGGGGRP